MSTTSTPPGPARNDSPSFELDYLLDDPNDPRTITIFSPSDDDLITQWITADIGAAVSIETMR